MSNRAELLGLMAEHEPEEIIASLERLVGGGLITIDDASETYTAARREQMVGGARRALANAIEWLVVEYLDGEGRKGPGAIPYAREQVDGAIDELIRATQKAAVAKWRMEEVI